MSDILTRDRRNRIYNSPSSVKSRADAARQPGEVDALRIRHLDEMREIGAKHRAESTKLRRDHDSARARDLDVRNGRGTPRLDEKDAKERAEMDSLHAAEKRRMAERHKKEMTAAVERNPAP